MTRSGRPGATGDSAIGADTPMAEPAPPAAPLTDRGGTPESDAALLPSETAPDERAPNRPSAPTVTTGVSNPGAHRVSANNFSARAFDAGDLARALLDCTPEAVVEALRENATPEQRQVLRAAFGGEPAPAVAPDTRTPVALATELTSVPIAARASLVGLLIDGLPDDRLAPLAHRLRVRLRATGEGDGVAMVRELLAWAGALSPLRRASLVGQVLETLDLETALLVENRAVTHVGLLKGRAERAAAAGSR